MWLIFRLIEKVVLKKLRTMIESSRFFEVWFNDWVLAILLLILIVLKDYMESPDTHGANPRNWSWMGL